jgi:hypothetical protein
MPTTVLPCQYKLSYFWLNNKLAFWCKPVTIDQSSVGCWIWNGTNWNSSKLQLSDIDTFICETF